MNSYPKNLIEKHINRFISSKFSNNVTSETTAKEIKYVTLPFLGHFSYYVRKSLSDLLKRQFPDINFRFIFVNRNTIGSLFKVKDPVPVPLCSNVVYCFTCPDCMSRYVGSSTRDLKIRISEHKGVSYRTNQQIKSLHLVLVR